mgnify:CR=1 FL=1
MKVRACSPRSAVHSQGVVELDISTPMWCMWRMKGKHYNFIGVYLVIYWIFYNATG